jgi:multiple sugar transport system substrate-binding protein
MGINRIAISLRVPFVNNKTARAELNTPDWQYTHGLFKALSDIPDNKKVKAAKNGFEVDQKSAMLVSYGARVGEMQELADSGKSFDWDLTMFPVRKDAQVQGMETESHVLALSSTAKNKDAAFQIIQFLSTNDELQSLVARNARISPLKDDKYKKLFGADLKALQGKNVQSIFKNKFGPNAEPSRYDELVKPVITEALNKVNKGTDTNTALREAEQLANQAIDSAKQAGK